MTTHKSALALPLLLLAAICAHADVFSFKADKMSGTKALGRETTVLNGNAEVRSDNWCSRQAA